MRVTIAARFSKNYDDTHTEKKKTCNLCLFRIELNLYHAVSCKDTTLKVSETDYYGFKLIQGKCSSQLAVKLQLEELSLR